MSFNNDSDRVVLENSVQNNSEPVLFNEKNYTFITDSTSNGGNFQSGIIQFDLSTLSNQSQWLSLNEAVIEFPVKITAQISAVGTSTATSSVTNFSAFLPKNGWHQWIDNVQLIINNQTVQSAQPYENISAQFRILSTWSKDTLKKWGNTCNFALDDCTGTSQGGNALSTTVGMNNSSNSVMTSVKGLDIVNNQTIFNNDGLNKRLQNLANYTPTSTTTLQQSILGNAQIRSAGSANVAVQNSSTLNDYLYTAYAMATVRLRDICDISEFPLVKNLKGYLYIGFNSSSIQLTTGAGAATLTNVSVTKLTGNTNPILFNNAGLTLPYYASGSTTTTILTTVSGASTEALGGSASIISNARLILPYYRANPKTDTILTKTQAFSTMEKIVNPFTIIKNQTSNYTITVGVPNPRKLVLIPFYTGLGGNTTLLSELSPFNTAPATSDPFSYLSNLQVYLANKPLFQYPIQYDFEFYQSEICNLGANGSVVEEMTSGLLTQELFRQNHRYYCIDLSRRNTASDGQSQSVQITATNASPNYDMRVIAILFYERKWIINTALCQLQSN